MFDDSLDVPKIAPDPRCRVIVTPKVDQMDCCKLGEAARGEEQHA